MLLLCFLGVLGTVAGELHISIFGGQSPEFLKATWFGVRAFFSTAASGSWLTWRVGRPLVGLNSLRSQREAELRFALIRANQRVDAAARFRDEEGEKLTARSRSRKGSRSSASDCLRYRQAHLDDCRIRMDFNCRSDRHRVARIFQRQMFFRRINGRGWGILSG